MEVFIFNYEQFCKEYLHDIQARENDFHYSASQNVEEVLEKVFCIIQAKLRKNKGSLQANGTPKKKLKAPKTIINEVVDYVLSPNYLLVQRIGQSDNKFIKQIYKESFTKVRSKVHGSQLNNTYDLDIFHDVWAGLIPKCRRKHFHLQADTKISTYIHSMYQNTILAKVNKKAFKNEVNSWDDPFQKENVLTILEEKESNTQNDDRAGKIFQYISTMTEPKKTYLIKFFRHNKSYKEIAKEHNSTESAVKQMTYRGKQMIKKWLRSSSND